MFTVISKPNCPFCDQAKALLKFKKVEFKEMIVDVGQTKVEGKEYITRERFFDMIPGARTVPQILDEHKSVIGGYTELRKMLEEGSVA